MDDEVPSIPPCKTHNFIGCEVTTTIGYWDEVPEDIEDSSHPRSNSCHVCPSKTRGTKVLGKEEVTMLHHGSQETHLPENGESQDFVYEEHKG